MIDDDDVDSVWLAAMVSNNPTLSLIFLIILITVAIIAYQNNKECSTKKCDAGYTAKLMEHDCLCVKKAE